LLTTFSVLTRHASAIADGVVRLWQRLLGYCSILGIGF